MTTRLYYSDAYLTAFSARIVDSVDDDRRVYLDRTAFYPTSGGQPFDRGTIAGIPVIDVVDEGERIAHRLDAALPAGSVADCVVDWVRRFDHMQQHTGQHLLSAVFAESYGLMTTSVHFGAASSSLDLDGPSLAPDDVVSAERRANAIVAENRSVMVSFEEAASATGLRKASERGGELRVVTIDGLDRSACGGTHVRATGEIGAILIRKVERMKKQIRVEFLCGARAVARARADYETLASVAHGLSASAHEVPELVAAQLERVKALDAQRRRLEAELHGFRARELYESITPDEHGVRRAVERDASSLDSLRGLAMAFTSLPKTVFVGSLAGLPTVLAAASEDSGFDAGRVLKHAIASVGGRGGGSPRMAQGTVPDVRAVTSVVETLSTAASPSDTTTTD